MFLKKVHWFFQFVKKMKIKIIFNALFQLDFFQLLKLLGVFISHPILSVMSFYATVKTIFVVEKYFPKNHTYAVGNAFRHALWCGLITMYSSKITSAEKSLKWCKKITDMHEELFKNTPLERKMDLHNNQIGMLVFRQILSGVHRQFFEPSFIIRPLLEKVKTAKIFTDLDFQGGEDLIYLPKK